MSSFGTTIRFSVDKLEEQASNRARIKLHVDWEGKSIEPLFYLVSLTEEKRYGYRHFELRDDDGNEIRQAYLSVDNRIFPRRISFDGKMIRGGLKRIYIDEQGNTVERNQVQRVDYENNLVHRYPSSLFTEKDETMVHLEKKVTMEEALDIDVKYTYVLFPTEINDDETINMFKEILARIEQGQPREYFCFLFNYRTSYSRYHAFLQLIDGHVYMLVGNKNEMQYFKQEVEIEEVTEDDIEDFELEFGF